MGFEPYTIFLVPKQLSPSITDRSKSSVQQVIGELRQKWPSVRLDEEELGCLSYPPIPGEVYLVHETMQGLIQILLTPSQGEITVSVRFAYCNPRSVYKPFMDIIAWLMERYEMYASVMASDDIPDLTDPQKVEDVLVPSMDYNRRLWQTDTGTSEEAILRTGDAVARFVTPHSFAGALV